MFHISILFTATIAAVEAAAAVPLLASKPSIANAELLVSELLDRMWELGPVFRPWSVTIWANQALYFQVFAKKPAKANVCWRKAERIAAELHTDGMLGRLLLSRARYASMNERTWLLEEAARLLKSDGSDPVSLGIANDTLLQLLRAQQQTVA